MGWTFKVRRPCAGSGWTVVGSTVLGAAVLAASWALPGLQARAAAPARQTQAQETIDLRAAKVEADNPNKTADFTQIVITQGTMRIQADRAHATGITGMTGFDEAQIQDGSWTFMGNVQIEAEPRGTVHSDQAVVQMRERRMSTATATGNPAVFQNRNAVTGELTHGHADIIVYDIDGAIVRLTNNAFITNGRNTITGPLVVYNIRQQRVVADSGQGATKPSVHVTIVPQNSASQGVGGALPSIGAPRPEPPKKPPNP